MENQSFVGKTKDLAGKPKLQLLKLHTLAGIARVREFGINKYGNDDLWMDTDPDEYLGASLRHIYKHLSGESLDPESGLPHIHHALTSLMLASEIIGVISENGKERK